jgi:tRNA1(Val) A37 N6-methylase TrmN6
MELNFLFAKDPIVFTNPPYMKSDSGKSNILDKKAIARHEINGDIRDFCKAAKKKLKYGGAFYAVYRPDRLADILLAMRENQLEPKRMTFVHSDISSRPSMVLVEAQKGASPSMVITPPLVLSKSTNVPTEDCNYIYENCAFPESFSLSNKS